MGAVEPAIPFLGELVKTGVLGLLLGLAIWALMKMFYLYRDSEQQRFTEALKNREALDRNTTAMDKFRKALVASRGGADVLDS
jgi:hypothetical protein